ncbi:hypothetical protein [Streptomyces sp. PT12]|uniref:hypothetical protein n=1 Tax=Streptomyces sp. PT12 TaxID=1510197 RepID=UPI0011BEFD58|nr:hypothetical protein [Streptomyces sp. PT12]
MTAHVFRMWIIWNGDEDDEQPGDDDPTPPWHGVDWHVHGIAWTARDHPPGQSVTAYLTGQPTDRIFAAGEVDAALEWLREQLEAQPFPAQVAAYYGGDPVTPRLEFAASRLRQPGDVTFGYTSSHKAFAGRQLVLCPRPGVPCPGRRSR